MAELSDLVGSSELTEWMAYSSLEPFGQQVDDMRAGLMPAITVNQNRERGAKMVSPFDFFPWVETPEADAPPVETPEQRAERIRALLQPGGSPDG